MSKRIARITYGPATMTVFDESGSIESQRVVWEGGTYEVPADYAERLMAEKRPDSLVASLRTALYQKQTKAQEADYGPERKEWLGDLHPMRPGVLHVNLAGGATTYVFEGETYRATVEGSLPQTTDNTALTCDICHERAGTLPSYGNRMVCEECA